MAKTQISSIAYKHPILADKSVQRILIADTTNVKKSAMLENATHALTLLNCKLPVHVASTLLKC